MTDKNEKPQDAQAEQPAVDERPDEALTGDELERRNLNRAATNPAVDEEPAKA